MHLVTSQSLCKFTARALCRSSVYGPRSSRMVGNIRAAPVLIARGKAPLSFVYAIDAEAEPVKNHHRVARRRAMIAIISYEIDYNAAAPINFPISH
jgi:hypothetical protein